LDRLKERLRDLLREALRERGVDYIEVRLMDLDPIHPVGIGARTMRFLDVFLVHCLLSDSPPHTTDENEITLRKLDLAAARGREPGVVLERGGRSVMLVQWGRQTLAECETVPAALDRIHRTSEYRDALAAAHAAPADPASYKQAFPVPHASGRIWPEAAVAHTHRKADL